VRAAPGAATAAAAVDTLAPVGVPVAASATRTGPVLGVRRGADAQKTAAERQALSPPDCRDLRSALVSRPYSLNKLVTQAAQRRAEWKTHQHQR
jgi:hypothetical protein